MLSAVPVAVNRHGAANAADYGMAQNARHVRVRAGALLRMKLIFLRSGV